MAKRNRYTNLNFDRKDRNSCQFESLLRSAREQGPSSVRNWAGSGQCEGLRGDPTLFYEGQGIYNLQISGDSYAWGRASEITKFLLKIFST